MARFNANERLSPEDVRLVTEACQTQRVAPAGVDLIQEGDRSGLGLVILEGWACRYKLLAEGTRQITAFLMPGDSCEPRAPASCAMPHAVATLTTARIAFMPRGTLETLIGTRPAIGRAVSWKQLVDEDTLHAWMVRMGRLDSLRRVAHLMCELHARAGDVGLTDGERLELPLTQAVIGDALGLTPIHVNRVLRKLRISGVMSLAGGVLTIADLARLAAFAGFDDGYLHRRNRVALPRHGPAAGTDRG